MHVGTNLKKSKSVAMFFPKTLLEKKRTPEDLDKVKRKQFIQKFKCLGSIINHLLLEDAEIEVREKEAWSLIGVSKLVFNYKDINIHVKPQKYTVSHLSALLALLWGCECWNTTKN